MPCNLCGKWNCVCQYSQSKQQQEFTSGFFSREAMKEHSDFHPQPKQEHGEPVASAWMYQGEMVNAFPWPPNDPRGCDNDKYWEGKGYTSEPLYTYPQPRKPLTNEQIDEIADTVANMPLVGIVHDFRTRFARAIEAAHNIKE